MNKNKNKITSPKNNLQEPKVQYESIIQSQDSNVISFSGHQEEGEEILNYQADLTPEQRMRNLYELICISFGLNTEELRNPKLNRTIIFENPDEHFS
jgi:hypothetical protein